MRVYLECVDSIRHQDNKQTLQNSGVKISYFTLILEVGGYITIVKYPKQLNNKYNNNNRFACCL